MKKLPWRRKYLGACFGCATPSQTHQHLSPWPSGEADSNFPAHRPLHRWRDLQPSLKLRLQVPNENKADRPRPTALASVLKRAELPVFYLVFGPVSIAGKRSLSHVIFRSASALLYLANGFFNSSHSLIFIHLSVFPPRHRPGDFFYQSSRSFGFPLQSPRGLEVFHQ